MDLAPQVWWSGPTSWCGGSGCDLSSLDNGLGCSSHLFFRDIQKSKNCKNCTHVREMSRALDTGDHKRLVFVKVWSASIDAQNCFLKLINFLGESIGLLRSLHWMSSVDATRCNGPLCFPVAAVICYCPRCSLSWCAPVLFVLFVSTSSVNHVTKWNCQTFKCILQVVMFYSISCFCKPHVEFCNRASAVHHENARIASSSSLVLERNFLANARTTNLTWTILND